MLAKLTADQNVLTSPDTMARIICFFATLLLVFITGFMSRQVWRAHDSKNWPTTAGLVIAFYGTPDYRYSVDGRTYTNSDVSCNELFNGFWSGDSAKYAVRYPLEARIQVHYYPSHPEVAVLETRFDSSGIYLVLTLLVITLMFAAGVVFGGR